MSAGAARKAGRPPASPGPFLPPTVNLHGTRGQILAASLGLFADKGYGATTVRDIAGQVGVLAGSLYSHFPSKEKILAELVHIGQSEHARCLRAAVLASPPAPREQLVRLVSALVLFHIQYQTLAIVSNAEMHVLEPSLARPSMDLRDQSLQLLSDILDRGNRLGDFKSGDVILTTTVIASLGARVANWYTPAFHLDADQVATQMTDIVMRIVG